MFARKLSIHLKPDTLAEFTTTLQQEIVPFLRQQPGFKDEVTFAAASSRDVLAISLWDTMQNAETYDASAHKHILKMLEKVIEGTPRVGVTEVLHSTFYEISAVAAAPAA